MFAVFKSEHCLAQGFCQFEGEVGEDGIDAEGGGGGPVGGFVAGDEGAGDEGAFVGGVDAGHVGGGG